MSSESNQQARTQALQAAAAVALEPTSLLEYRSHGQLLIIGALTEALSAAGRLPDGLQVGIVAREATPAASDNRYAVLTVGQSELQLSGHLGQYRLDVLRDEQTVPIAPLLGWKQATVDLILDLSPLPLLDYEMIPFGYFATRGDAILLEQALSELPELVGEFEKVKYFSYDPDLCAHGNSGLAGCTRCLDACPAGAISSLGDKIQVDPYYCQGGGSCATACPSGAIVYNYPKPADSLNRLRVLLRTYMAEGGCDPIVLFHDREQGQALLQAAADYLPSHILAVAVEEIGSVGMELWLAALAYGARRVVLLDTEQVTQRVRRELQDQLSIAQALLSGFAYPVQALELLRLPDGEPLGAALAANANNALPVLKSAGFAGSNEKRNMLFAALDWLAEHAVVKPELIPLPDAAPFGCIEVDRNACTLCMACVSVCPASAVLAGGDTPRLDFIEMNCLQCGLCEQACPEDAIRLEARYLVQRSQRMQRRILNEEAPFLCIACGKPFATQSVIQKMTAKLSGHSMFADPKALRRLQMCGDCRVRDMFEQDYYRKT